MHFYFFDSSATVKNYITENGSSWVKAIFNTISTDVIYAASITEIEVVAAFARRRKGKAITETFAGFAISQFVQDFLTEFSAIETTSKVIFQAVSLADKHSLRGYDAMQLASALEIFSRLNALGVDFTISGFTFVSADNELNVAAQAEGLAVENPNNYP